MIILIWVYSVFVQLMWDEVDKSYYQMHLEPYKNTFTKFAWHLYHTMQL